MARSSAGMGRCAPCRPGRGRSRNVRCRPPRPRREILLPAGGRAALRLDIELLRRLGEVAQEGWAEPALHVQVRRVVPVAASFRAPPIKAMLVPGERRVREYQCEAMLGI